MADANMNKKTRILLVDDEQESLDLIAEYLTEKGFDLSTSTTAEHAIQLAEQDGYQIAIVDLHLPGMTGSELLKHIKKVRPHIQVIMITGYGTIRDAVECMKLGASDFITKPWTNEQLLHSVRSVLGVSAARPGEAGTRGPDREELDARYDFGALVGRDPRLLRILEIIGRVAPTDASVLITGESGTGKELVAEAVHRNSRRQRGPFVKVNLGGISSTLFESEMFGYEKGAFTDARSDRKGRFEMADGGTIFLDEIGDLDASSQVKLLRVLQDRTFVVLGSILRRAVDVLSLIHI